MENSTNKESKIVEFLLKALKKHALYIQKVKH